MSESVSVPLRQALHELAPDVRILAGGTDFYPALGSQPVPDKVLDLNRVAGLDNIESTDDGWRIGAMVTWSQLTHSDLPPAFDALKAAAAEVGSIQIQNTATIGGNICNASPAADGVPPLLCLDAEVELASLAGTRTVALSEFITGPRSTCRQHNELLLAIRIPAVEAHARSTFFKLGARRYLIISIAMVSVLLIQDEGGQLSDVRIAVGSCSAVAQRLSALESALLGQAVRSDVVSLVTPTMFDVLTPIDDVRASAVYRQEAVREIVCRLLTHCINSLPDVADSKGLFATDVAHQMDDKQPHHLHSRHRKDQSG